MNPTSFAVGVGSSSSSSHQSENEHRLGILNSLRNTSYYTARVRCGGCQKLLPSKDSLIKHVKGKGPNSHCSSWYHDIYQPERSVRLAEMMQERARRRQATREASGRAGENPQEGSEGMGDSPVAFHIWRI